MENRLLKGEKLQDRTLIITMKEKIFNYHFLIVLFSIFLLPISSNAQLSIKVGSTTRTMLVYTPSGITKDRPLVISMHGMNQTMYDQKNQTQLESVAEANNFLLVFPQAVNNQWQLWGTDDVDFILAIIDEMYNSYGIDRDRVYLSGFSMGGMMTYYAATKIADKIAAFAPVSGFLMSGPDTTSSRPIPIIHIHGADDGYVPYSNVQTHMNAWVKRNGCDATAQVTTPYPADKLTSKSVKYYWAPGKAGVEVVLIGIAGVGHWYSDDPNGVFTSQEIWNFCNKYSLKFGVPVFKYASVTDNNPKQVQVVMSESIADSGYFHGFTVKIDSLAVTIDSVVKSDSNKLVINLSNSIVRSNNISLSYSNGNVVSVYKKILANFNDTLVDNLLKGASPRIIEAITNKNGDTLVVKFNMKMQIPSDISALTLSAGYNGQKSIPIHQVSFLNNDSTILAFPLDSLVYRDYNLLLTYTGNSFVSADTGLMKTVTDMPIVNISNGLPVHINSGKIEADGITLSLQFSKPMVLESGQLNYFIFDINGKSINFTGFSVKKDTIKFTLPTSVHYGDTVTISYTPGDVKATDNGPLEVFADTVDNQVNVPVWIEIPGKIEAENYAFKSGMKTETTSDVGGGLNVGYIASGDWLEYTIENNTSVTDYQIDFRLAALNTGAVISYYVDSVKVGKFNVPSTSNWQVYKSVAENISITPGKHYLKVVATVAGFNINYMNVHEIQTAIRNITGSNVTIYPNPVSTEMIISSGDFRHNKIEVFDVTGKLTISSFTTGEPVLHLPVHLSDGVYIVKISNAIQYYIKKIVVTNN